MYTIDHKRKTVHRDTAELVAALKKHLVTNFTDDSTLRFSALVERNKQGELILRKDESHYKTIKSYIDLLCLPKNSFFEHPDDYIKMITQTEDVLKYFVHSDGYKKEKLDTLMYTFLNNLIEH